MISSRYDGVNDLLAMRTPGKTTRECNLHHSAWLSFGDGDLNFRPALAKAKPNSAVIVQKHEMFLFPRSNKLAECIALPLQVARKLTISNLRQSSTSFDHCLFSQADLLASIYR